MDNELYKKKVDYLMSLGFSTAIQEEDGECVDVVWYKLPEKIFITLGDESFEDMKKEVESLLVNVDINERDKEMPFNGDEEDPFTSNSEDVNASYICKELQKVPTPVFRRLSLDGNRFYYRVMEDGTVKIYASATNLINDGYADSKDQLNQWKELQKLMGRDPKEVSEYEADKGTIMHYLYGLYLIGRDIYLRRSFIIKAVEDSDLRISKKNMEKFKSSISDLDDMIERLKRFAKFCTEYKLRPLFIEKILSCEKYEVASPIDLLAEITIEETVEGYFGEVYKMKSGNNKKGDPKKSTKKIERKLIVIIDFKSGNMNNSQIFQLELYRRMVEEWYDIKVDRIYNFSPKSESSKKYTLRDRTNSKELRKADCVFEQGMINHQNKEKKFTTHVGCLNINNEYKEEDYTITYDIAEELSKRFKD